MEKNTNFHFLGGLLPYDHLSSQNAKKSMHTSLVDINYPGLIDWMNKIRKRVDTVLKEITLDFKFGKADVNCKSNSGSDSSTRITESKPETESLIQNTILSTEKPVSKVKM